MFNEKVLKTLLQNTPIGYAYLNVLYDEFELPYDFELVEYNPSFGNIMGINEKYLGKSFNEIGININFINEITTFLRHKILIDKYSSLSQCFYPSGKCFNIHTFAVNKYSVIIQVIDRTKEEQLKNELIKRTEELKYLSYHDKLTGLYNRAFFEEEMKRLDTDRNLPIAIIMGDTNGLKLLNDVFGHTAGDNLIKTTANILNKSCRQGDIVARWGGDEFIILLPRTSSKTALKIINRIKSNFNTDKFDYDYLNIPLGYSVKKHMSKSLLEVISEAENNMYKNKAIEGQQIRKLIIGSMIDYLYEGCIEVKNHMERLKKYTTEIGEKLKLTQEDINKLNIVCEIHDIGNVSIDKDILFKMGALNDEDWEEIKKHPEIGYRIAKSIPELTDVANYILHHHERWDGQGYPLKLKGEEIPLLSRIFSIVDAFDSMTQDKFYRKAYSKKQAIQYLKDNAGKQFDKDIVEIFLKIIE